MQFGQAAHQRQAKACAARLAVEAVVDLVEGREDHVELVARDARAVVAHHDLEIAVGGARADHFDPAAHWRELDGVGHKIDQDLLERPLVGIKFRRASVDIDDQRLVLFTRLGADQLQGDVEGAGRIQRMGRDVHAPGLDLSHVQQVVDQRQQMGARGMDVAGIIAVTLRTDRAETFLGDDFRKAQDRVQWRAQFMAHIGQEGGLGGVGGFRLEALAQRLVAGLFQLARQVFDLEAQAGVLAHPQHQGPAGMPHLESHEGRQNAHYNLGERLPENETRGHHQGQRQQVGEIHLHVAAARHHQAGDHSHHAGGQEHVVQAVARFPAQPGQQAPGKAAKYLDHDKALQPGIGIAFIVVIMFVGGGHQRGGAHRGGHRQRHEQGLGEADMAEDAGGTQDGGSQRPKRRGDAGIARGAGGERQLRLDDARFTLLALGDEAQQRHAANPFVMRPLLRVGS